MTDSTQNPEAVVNETKKQVFEYRLHVKGVFGRNRKVKMQSFPILDSDVALRGIDISAPAVQVLGEVKPKPGCQYKVIETPVTVEKSTYDGRTVTSRSFMMFSGIAIDQGVV